jgi:predicted MPP superfamily phosphohydrolase
MKEAEGLISEIHGLISQWETRLASLPEELISYPTNCQNRSIRMILGHLIDSASNNTHRIVHLHYQPTPLDFPNYASFGNNDRWIAIQNYQQENWNNMVQLWKYLLLHYCHLLKNIRDDKLENEWIAGPDRKIPLISLVVDFNRHLKLHLNEIEELISKSS